MIHQENQGLAETRNVGILAASTDYFMFVDSDDWVKPNFCERAYQLLQDAHSNIVIFGYDLVNNGKIVKERVPVMKEGYQSLPEAIELLLGHTGNYVWNKIFYKKSFQVSVIRKVAFMKILLLHISYF